METSKTEPSPHQRRGIRDPALVVALIGIVIAGLSALYSHQQAVVSGRALDREIELGRTRALNTAIDLLAQVEQALRCRLETKSAVDACNEDMKGFRAQAREMILDPILTRDYALLHMDLESLDRAMVADDVDELAEAIRHMQRSLDFELDRMSSDVLAGASRGPIRLRLALGANDIEADLKLRRKFDRPHGTSGSDRGR